MNKITNATKAAIITAVNSLLGLVDALGFQVSKPTVAYVFIGVNVVLGFAAFFTRKMSPRWQETVATIAADVTTVADEVSSVKQAAPARAVAKKPSTKTAAVKKKTT